MTATVINFLLELVIETRNRVCNIISEIELGALQLKTNSSPATIDQETVPKSSIYTKCYSINK